MDIFDKYIFDIEEILSGEEKVLLQSTGAVLKLSEKNHYLMDKDTGLELGGYPKESVNILVPTTKHFDLFDRGNELIGEKGFSSRSHISFGKIIFLECAEISDDDIYDFYQSIKEADSRLYIDGSMVRISPVSYETNLKLSKGLINGSFSYGLLCDTYVNRFASLKGVKKVHVVMLFGESGVYKKLLPIAEKIKEVSVALNHIFDGIEMDCGRCDLAAVCDEINSLRTLHKGVSGDGSN